MLGVVLWQYCVVRPKAGTPAPSLRVARNIKSVLLTRVLGKD